MARMFKIEFKADTDGNWCSMCAGRLYETREAAQAALDADETARPDQYGNTCSMEIVEVDASTIKINIWCDKGTWFGARWIDGEYDGTDELDVADGASAEDAERAAREMPLVVQGERIVAHVSTGGA